MDKKARLARLQEECAAYFNELYAPDQKVYVFGDGDPQARVMLVGEAPGAQEALLGKPFVGKAGKNLDEFLERTELKRAELYITNTVKFRPVKISDKGEQPHAHARGNRPVSAVAAEGDRPDRAAADRLARQCALAGAAGAQGHHWADARAGDFGRTVRPAALCAVSPRIGDLQPITARGLSARSGYPQGSVADGASGRTIGRAARMIETKKQTARCAPCYTAYKIQAREESAWNYWKSSH